MTDAQQFEAFMKNYQNMVFSTAMRLLANPTEAQDISQEVFLKAYERFADLQHESNERFHRLEQAFATVLRLLPRAGALDVHTRP